MTNSLVPKLRKDKGWTQEVLAEKSSVTVRTIQRLESGENVSLGTLTVIANALSVSVTDLVELIEEQERPVSLRTKWHGFYGMNKVKITKGSLVVLLIVGGLIYPSIFSHIYDTGRDFGRSIVNAFVR